MHFTEKLAYDFRRDLSKTMNDIEGTVGKRMDQLSKAISELSKQSTSVYAFKGISESAVLSERSNLENIQPSTFPRPASAKPMTPNESSKLVVLHGQ